MQQSPFTASLAGVNAEDVDGISALEMAAGRGHAAVVSLLVQLGADLRAWEDQALYEASATGHAAVVQLLIQHGADVNAHGASALVRA